MGNCCKRYADQDSEGDSRERLATYGKGFSRERLASCSDGNSRGSTLNRGEGSRLRDRFDSNNGRQLLLDNQSNSSMPMHADDCENQRNKMEFVFRAQHPGSGGIANVRQGEQVAAGWPSWLSELAGEAIKGWIPRKPDSFKRLDKIGQGTYSNVYRACDLEEGKIVALKKVKFDSFDPQSIRFMAREIHILRRLQHPNIIKLEGVVTSRMSCTVYLVFEYMENDLARLASRPGLRFTEPQIKCYMKQLLRGLNYCHRRGILHRDIKGSNLLIGSSGVLKIADFGLANFYHQYQVEPMTNRVITLWYRPPELLLGATCYGTAIDMWSTGCVLAELYASKPIMTGRTEVDQLHQIFKLCGSPSEEYWRISNLPHATIFKPQQPHRRRIAEILKDFPAPALALIETLLSIDPADRMSAAHALNSEFFSSEPLACEPAELPKYPSSKELDARVRAEEARRQGEAGSKGKTYDDEGEGTEKSRTISAPDPNAESILSMEEGAASGFLVKPPQPQAVDEEISGPEGTLHHRESQFGLLVQRAVSDEVGKNMHDAPGVSIGSELSRMSSFVVPNRRLTYEEWRDKYGSSQQEITKAVRKPASYNETHDIMRKQGDNRHTQSIRRYANDDGKNSGRDQLIGKNIHHWGPLIAPPGNVYQMRRDNECRHVQETSRRAHVDKAKQKRAQGEAIPLPTNALYVGPGNRIK